MVVILISLFSVCFAITGWAVDIVANKSVAQTSLTVASAKAIFGMRQVKWPDGTPQGLRSPR